MFKSLTNIQDELSQLTQDIDQLQSSLQGDTKATQPLAHKTDETFFLHLDESKYDVSIPDFGFQ